VPERQFTDAELDAAIEALGDRERFRAAEERVMAIAPQLQRILNDVLQEGGYFDEAFQGQVLKAATTPDEDERLTAVRTLVAEETRVGMLIGVAVGWELARELEDTSKGD
jgi:hypothetical protein